MAKSSKKMPRKLKKRNLDHSKDFIRFNEELTQPVQTDKKSTISGQKSLGRSQLDALSKQRSVRNILKSEKSLATSVRSKNKRVVLKKD